jgi:hypothetical protein
MRKMSTLILAVVLATAALAGAARGQVPSRTADLLSSTDLRALVAAAATPADHTRISRHFAAVAAGYDADARAHRELAVLYRKSPTASETKRPGAPDTAAHCERLASRATEAAREARHLADGHARAAARAR